MASHKNQHFVPRCYLKPFSLDGQGLAINLYNIDRRLGIRNVPVKGQCSGSYFYGEDLRLEKLLQKSEGSYAQTLSRIGEQGYRLNGDDKFVLRHFCYLQHCRTEAASRRAVLFMSDIADIAWNGQAPADWRTTIQDAVLSGMRTFSKTMNVIDDLKVCLIRNKTGQAFVTSDDPAVLTNRWYSQNPKAKGLSGGIGNSGALFLLPLTPRVLCMIYDGDVYSLPNNGGWIDVDRVADIDAFNQHQFLGCRANIYFADWTMLSEVAHSFEEALPYRPAAKHELVTAVLDREDDRAKRYRVVARDQSRKEGEVLIHVRSIQPRPSRWPSVIKWRPNPKIYSKGTGEGFVRRSRLEDGAYSAGAYRRIS